MEGVVPPEGDLAHDAFFDSFLFGTEDKKGQLKITPTDTDEVAQSELEGKSLYNNSLNNNKWNSNILMDNRNHQNGDVSAAINPIETNNVSQSSNPTLDTSEVIPSTVSPRVSEPLAGIPNGSLLKEAIAVPVRESQFTINGRLTSDNEPEVENHKVQTSTSTASVSVNHFPCDTSVSTNGLTEQLADKPEDEIPENQSLPSVRNNNTIPTHSEDSSVENQLMYSNEAVSSTQVNIQPSVGVSNSTSQNEIEAIAGLTASERLANLNKINIQPAVQSEVHNITSPAVVPEVVPSEEVVQPTVGEHNKVNPTYTVPSPRDDVVTELMQTAATPSELLSTVRDEEQTERVDQFRALPPPSSRRFSGSEPSEPSASHVVPDWLLENAQNGQPTNRKIKRYSFASSSSGSTGDPRSVLEKTRSIDMLEALLDQGTCTKPVESTEVQETAPSAARNAGDAAAHHAECAVCFEPLCDGTSVVFVDTDRLRVCRHYFHEECVTDLRPDSEQTFRCPLCRTPFTIMTKMPDPRLEPKLWFQLACTTKTGQLTKMEVRDVLLATVNTDCDILESVVDKRWKDWDKSNTGTLTSEEADGLLEFVRMNVPGRRHKPPPSLITDPGSWFEFIDTSGTGLLTEGLISRALIKSFKGGGAEISEIAQMVGELFPLFATANPDPLSPLLRGEAFDPPRISKTDFLMEDGLAQAIVAELRHQNVDISTYQDQEDEEFAQQLQREINENDETEHPGDIINVVPWECLICTFHNVPGDEKCQMCETAKPVIAEKIQTGGCTAAPVPGDDEDVIEERVIRAMPVFIPPPPAHVTPPISQQRVVTPPLAPLPSIPSPSSLRRFSTSSVGNQPPVPLFLPESTWEADTSSDACHGCQSKFTFFLRRHHCRGCGRLHCAECAPNKMVPTKGYIRICASCHQHPSLRELIGRQINRRSRAQSSMQ